MKEPWKIGVGLLALALLILVCPFLLQLAPGSGTDWSGYLELSEDKIHFWVERERVQPDQIVVSGAWREELSRAEAGQVELLNLVTLYGIFYQVLGPCEYATQLGGGGGGGNAVLPTWPQIAEEMDDFLGFGGRRIPDTASTSGRNKVVWEPSNGCVVPLHRELAIGTLRGILRQARVTPDEFVERL